MSAGKWLLLAACVLIAMALVYGLGQDYANEARAFLRTLLRALL